MIWGEQVMNLWGAPVARYTNNRVPLLGLGQIGPMDIARGAAPYIGGGFLAGALAMHLAHKFHLFGMR